MIFSVKSKKLINKLPYPKQIKTKEIIVKKFDFQICYSSNLNNNALQFGK